MRIFILFVLVYSLTDPSESLTSFVVVPLHSANRSQPKIGPAYKAAEAPVLSELKYEANITNRMATTLVTGKIKNSGEFVVSLVLPAAAFISDFHMNMGEDRFMGTVKSKEEAESDFQNATSQGGSAALVESSGVHDTNEFKVTINVEEKYAEATFYLLYVQLLERQNGHYEIVTNLFPGQSVDNITVNINVEDSRELIEFSALPFRNAKNNQTETPNTDIKILRPSSTTGTVEFIADSAKQQEIADKLGDAVFGVQMIIVFAVTRDCSGGDYMVRGSYFMHFFAPCDLQDIPKEVVFVLDTSGSMGGQKITQLKSAMEAILPQLREHDYFTVVQVSYFVRVFTGMGQIDIADPNVTTFSSPRTADNIESVLAQIEQFKADGGTNMFDALQTALNVTDKFKSIQMTQKDEVESIVIFLTDGKPSCGGISDDCIEDEADIVSQITSQNSGNGSVPIFCLSFGEDADQVFLEKLCSQNKGFHRHIYTDKDAGAQVIGFFKEISTIELRSLAFTYPNAKEVTKSSFPQYFSGYEYTVSGKLKSSSSSGPKVTAESSNGTIEWSPQNVKPLTRLDTHWAYLSLKQILQARNIASNTTYLDKAALNLALQYHFVTPVSSLLLETPEGLSVAHANASKTGPSHGFSVDEDDMTLEEFIQDIFKDPLDDNSAISYVSGVIVFLGILVHHI